MTGARGNAAPLLGLVVLALAASPAGAQEMIVGAEIRVAGAPAGMLLLEPHLAAHPSDPSRLLAVAYETTPDYGEGYCRLLSSSDGGATWSATRLEGHECPDGWVSLDEERAVVTALGEHPSSPLEGSQLLAYFSDDRGASWFAVPQTLGRYHDNPRSVLAADGSLYVTSGLTWRGSSGYLRNGVFVGRIPPGTPHLETRNRLRPSNLAQVADGAAVLSDGSLLVTYQDYQRPVGGPDRAFRGRGGALQTRRTWAVLSTDRGDTFSPPMLVTESCSARPTFLAIDASDGPSRDRLYHVCPGDGSRLVLLAISASRGEEWTDATPIEAPTEQESARMFPQVAVNRDGTVAIAWMDRRDDLSGRCYAPYLAVSIDQGATFSAPVRVASAISCPDSAGMGRAGSRFVVGGDYFGLAGAADGRFHVLWPDARNGTFELYATSITVNLPAATPTSAPAQE